MRVTSLSGNTATDVSRHVKEIGPLSVLFAMATAQEYGDHLKARIQPLITGVGPVEAAAATAATLAALEHTGRRPDLIFSLGSAGSRTLDHAAIYQISKASYRDMDASALGFDKGVTPFLDQPAHVEVFHQMPDIPAASIATGASFVTGDDHSTIDADMVDMETYAVLRAAHRSGTPMIGLRGISDGRSEFGGIHDWTEYLHIIDEKLARAIDDFAEYVATGRFSLDGA